MHNDLHNSRLLVQVQAEFHGISYLVSTCVQGERLCVEVEQADNASRWRGDFSAHCGIAETLLLPCTCGFSAMDV